MEQLNILHLYDRQPGQVHIRLERNSKGYNWEVSFAHEDPEVALAKIREVDARLRTEFGQAASGG